MFYSCVEYPSFTEVLEISAILEELEDLDVLAAWLNIRMITIKEKCQSSVKYAECQWRELVKAYYDMNAAGDPYKTAADIADILDKKMSKKKQAQQLKQLIFTSEFVTIN